MPIVKPQGLTGLKGLGSLSKQEYDAFVDKNKDLIASHNYDPVYINNLYSNKQFIDKFGIDQFKAVPNINMRNELFKDAVVGEEWDKLYSPINPDGTRDNSKGLGADYEKYSQMSTDAKQKVLESDYLTSSEFNEKWSKDNDFDPSKTTGIFAPLTNQQMSNYGSLDDKEAHRQFAKEKNNRILEHIYNDDVDAQAKKLSTAVRQSYQDPSISAMDDEQVKEAFVQAITPSSMNRGISNFAAYYGDGSKIESEMQDFSVDDMREVLAKKLAYDQYMSPDMASTALNNEAQRYIKDHQGSLTRLGLFANDVGISALSYTADKINGIYNLGLMAADQFGDKPIVWVDDSGNVADPNKVVVGMDGTHGVNGEDGNFHPVHKEQIDRTTLHLMGKNFDGAEDESILNPQYWTRAEQFGTLDENEQKQWEKLGVSPHKVVYDPNEDSDLWYESFKMMSFGLADGASMFIPYGIGIAGKALSTASKVGRLGRGLGKVVNFAGKALGAESEFGQAAQGMAGAGGIAYAYERGAFQETLQQNLANAEQTLADRSRNDVYNLYNNDEDYKAQIDALVDERAANMKAAYIAQLSDDEKSAVNEQKLDEMLRARAKDAVMAEQIDDMVSDRKKSDEYRLLQEEAINSAGRSANTVFLPEAIKYGFVNTIGFRKWLYSNPASLQKKAGKVFTGLKEVTTSAGRKRLTAKASKFLTRGDKMKQFGKTLGSQVWGGAWTNGTDDMMVDAAERINEDSFNRYLNAYANGESLADVAGYSDGLYSYWMGLNNSLGQETTWNAAAVGGIGSVVSFTPNMANIAHLATKEGRQAFKDRYMRERVYETDESGFKTPKVDEQGNPVYRDISMSENWRDRFNYFIQNGVLNTYYGKKIAEQDMQNHADYVNNILDDYNDFKVIEELLESDNYLQNAENAGDQKTMRFVKAIHAANALNHLGNSKNDPAAMSSVIQNAKELIERASQLTQDNMSELFTEEETNNMIAQYYANNPGLTQSDENNLLAINNISKNARELKEATEAYDEAEKQVQSVERSIGRQIDPAVRDKMKLDQALNGHWDSRLSTMRDEIGDTSSDSEISEDMIIPSLGNKKNAESLIKVYERQQAELQHELEEQKKETEKKEEILKKAQDDLDLAEDSDAKYKAQQAVTKAQAEVDDAHQQEGYLKSLDQRTIDKKNKVQKAINNYSEENEGKVLTAAEIFNLDPVSRARMMNPDNRYLYSKEQVMEIDNLEKELLMKDGDALQKIQDIALLTQRIKSNQDAYSRMAKNPEAAAVQLEAQRSQSADAAHKLINQRNAETVADVVSQFEEGMKGHDDVTQEQKEQFVFRTLRKLNSSILNILDEDRMLPQYQKQIADAKEWGKVVSDISAVMEEMDKDDTWKQNISANVDAVINSATNKQGIMDALEKVVDDTVNTQASEDFELILQGLNKLGYQRDATVLETRKQRKEREEAVRKQKEDAEKAARAAAEEAAAKASAEEKEWAEKENKNTGNLAVKNIQDVSLEEEEGEESSVEKTQSKNEVTDTSVEDNSEAKVEQNTVDNTEAEESQANGHIIQDGDHAKVITPSIETQAEEAQGNKEQYVSDTGELDAASANGIGEHIIESNSTTLSGRAMGEYEMAPLAEDGIVVRKKGENPNDSMNKYFAWMNAEKIKLQNIIDTELGQILRRNPNAKIKFMAIRPQDNATHDGDMKRHLMLVLDYDNNINKGITQIHKKENGGVIKSQGKEYLVIGVAGYGNKNADQLALYDILFSNNPRSENGYGLVRRGMGDFFRNNPSERFYVHPTLETEIVGSSLIPGYIVHQLEKDGAAKVHRSISELLADPERNPLGLDMESLSWGIQEKTKFLVVGTSLDRVMVPRRADENAGSAFVLVPAGNGKMVPSYLIPLMYNEMRNGVLKDRVNEMLNKITSPKYADRLAAATELSNIFYMDKDLDFILVGKDGTSHRNTISLVHNGNVFKTFVLDSNFDRQQFMNAFAEMNPRINITASVFQSPLLLKQYDEAGALQTDIARLATAGSSYSIYGLDAKGNIIKPDVADNASSRNDGTYRNTGKSQVVYGGNYYHYNAKEGKYYLNGEQVNDAKTITALDYNRRVINVSPTSSEGVWDVYVLNSSEEHPEVVKINRNSKDVNVVSEEQAKEMVKKIKEEKEAKEREEAAKKAIEEAEKEKKEIIEKALENGEANLSEEWVVDPDTGDLVPASTLEASVDSEFQEKEKKEKEEESPVKQQNSVINRVNVDGSRGKEGTQTFDQLAKSKKHRKEVTQVIKKKWPEAPNNLAELEKFLREKNVEVEAIGTTDNDVRAWLNTLENCR